MRKSKVLQDLSIPQLILFCFFVRFTKDGKFLGVIFLFHSVLFYKSPKFSSNYTPGLDNIPFANYSLWLAHELIKKIPPWGQLTYWKSSCWHAVGSFTLSSWLFISTVSRKGAIIIKPKLLNARKRPLRFEIVPISCLCLFCSHFFMTVGTRRLGFTLLSAELSFHAKFVVWQAACIYYHP